MKLLLDPDGFVVLQFDTFEDRAMFLKDKVSSGELWQNARASEDDKFYVAWKLANLTTCQGFEL